MIRKIPDDSDRNYDIVHMIKKIAIGLESKNVDDLRAIAHELEAWVPHGNWGKLDVKTKVFVEHILIALARLQLGFEIIDKGAEELTDIRQKVENDEIRDVMDETDEPDELDGRYDELVREYDELQKENFDLAQKITTENIDKFTRSNLDSVDRRKKFTCEKCGIEKRSSAPGVSNCKEVDGHKICGRCYRAFQNWFEKTNTEDWDALLWNLWVGTGINRWNKKNKRAWDGGPIDKEKTQDFVRKLMRDYSLPNGQIDWKKFHRVRREIEKKQKQEKREDRRRKERYNKDELSDDEKESLK